MSTLYPSLNKLARTRRYKVNFPSLGRQVINFSSKCASTADSLSINYPWTAEKKRRRGQPAFSDLVSIPRKLHHDITSQVFYRIQGD